MNKRLAVLVFMIGVTVGFLVRYVTARPDVVAVDAAQAGEACCAALRHSEVQLDACMARLEGRLP